MYSKIYVFVLNHTFNNPCYELLKQKIGKYEKQLDNEILKFIDVDENGIMNIKDIKVIENSRTIVIFDNIQQTDKDELKKIRKYFSTGRVKGIDCFYLSQSYFDVDKRFIRDQCNIQSVK